MLAATSRCAALRSIWIRPDALPPNFVKEGDTRTSGYREQFGTDECWELDALSPTVIADLIRAEIEAMIDTRKRNAALAKEKRGRRQIEAVAANWTKVEKLIKAKHK
jgi:hypothetical protein